MIVNVINYEDDLISSLYGDNDSSVLDYLGRQYENVSRYTSDKMRNFISKAKSTFDRYNGSDAMLRRRVRYNQQENGIDSIRSLKSISELNKANIVMQRYIMAMPELRELNKRQLIQGFDLQYVDMEPGSIGKDHYDYRRVYDGLMVEENDEFVINYYYDELHEGDRDLMLSEKIDILSTWDNIRMQYLSNITNRDFTDQSINFD